jgi:glycosyltransferase involved in cell wall biosynthesis
MGMTDARRLRIAAVLTHPTQYFSPWFRWLHANRPDVEFTAVYATAPDADRQGVGFGKAFQWDVPLLDGYPNLVLRSSESGDDVHSSRFFGVDAPILPTLKNLKPDAVLVCGWHSIFQVRTLLACRRLGIPAIYRGDTTLIHEPTGIKGRLWRWKTYALLKHGFKAHLAVGTRSRQYLEAMGVPRSTVFASPHCVDNEFFAAAADRARRENPPPKKRYGLEGKSVALFAGKLEEIKRPGDLLAAVAKLGKDWAALCVGGGPLEAGLKREAERLGATAVFAGFHNQSEMGRAYAAADLFVLPSHTETWGLAVNEALACGVPCVVSHAVGCAPDLIESGRTGEVYPRGDSNALGTAMSTVRNRLQTESTVARHCREKAATHSFESAAQGLIDAATAVCKRPEERKGAVLAAFGTMAFVGGLERQSFQTLEVLKRDGRRIHVVGNKWANWKDPSSPHPIKELADAMGASWGFTSCLQPLGIARRPIGFVKFLFETIRVCRELVRDVQANDARFVFLPEYGSALRYCFALLMLRWRGVRVVLRVGNAPERIPRHEWMWRRVLPPLVDRFVANSEFGARRMRESGVPVQKIRCIKNAIVVRSAVGEEERNAAEIVNRHRTVLCVGQIAPFKGPDVLLDAAEKLLAKGRDFHVAFLGRMADWPEDYKRYCDELDWRSRRGRLEGRVHFLGEAANVQHVMKQAWLLAAPIQQEETFGNVVLEAQASGLPAVVTPRGGLVELVEHRRTGFICKDADAASIVEGLEWFLADESRRQSAMKESLAASRRSDWPYQRVRYEAAWRDVFNDLEGERIPAESRKTTAGTSLRVVS